MERRVRTKTAVVSVLRGHRDQIRALGVSRVGLFGSFVRGQQTRQSDVDLLVSFEPDRKTFRNFMQLSFLLEDLLGRPVEIVTPESLSPYLGPHILTEVEYVSI